jgi:hypothetical protein
MLQVLPRKRLSASRTRLPAVNRTRPAWPPCLKALALGGALLLADGVFCHAAETSASARTASIPAKAPARSNRPAKSYSKSSQWKWDLRVSAKPEGAPRPYTLDVARQHLQSLSLEVTALLAVSIYIGVDQWDWGRTGFHPYREGWFGKSTGYGGIDKLGHAWSAHVMSDCLTWRLQFLGFNKYESAITAAMLTGVAFLVVEIGDGFSKYGASYEDFVASAVGIGFSFLRNTVPGLPEKVDFRMQYIPTGHGDSLGLGDYSGKKFLLAWKLAGFEAFKDGPLRYLELHTGYYTRGNYEWEHAAGIAKTRSAYVGIGLNLSELLFSHPSVRDTAPAAIGRTLVKYIQAPYSYLASDNFR